MESHIERIAQPLHDVLYDRHRGEIVSIVPASGPNRPVRSILLHANLQLTRRCNLACLYCRTSSSPSVDTTAELSTARWLFVFDRLKEDGVRSVFATGGEIFVRPDIWDLLEELERRFMVHILTNGHALADDVSPEQRAIVARLASVQISLDSATPELHDRFRGKGSWARALAAIETVRALDVEAVISAVVAPGGGANVCELAILADRLGVKLLLRPLLPQGRGARFDGGAVDAMDLSRSLGHPPYARGFLAYSEELSRYGVGRSDVSCCGVVAVGPYGETKALLDS
jgi:MoaA/NifB/PqqE/SkfB family radical SAM enzyme